MFNFIFVVIFLAVIAAIVIISIGKSKPPASSSYTPPSWMNEDISTGRRPRISAEVSEDFYDSVQEYCQRNSMTISSLIRNSVETYMRSNPVSDSVVIPSPKPSPRRSTTVIRPDGSWKCPRCGRINAKYVGTCSCGVDKDGAPAIKAAVSRKPYYIREDGSWKCPRCGKVNAKYVGTCSCGKTKE